MVLRRARRTERVLAVDETRFAAGWRLLPEDRIADLIRRLPPGADAGPKPSFTVDLIRARDLVALTINAYDLEVAVTPDGPVIRTPKEGGPVGPTLEGWLVVTFPYQHVA